MSIQDQQYLEQLVLCCLLFSQRGISLPIPQVQMLELPGVVSIRTLEVWVNGREYRWEKVRL